jgi:hypothetical protein
LSLSEHSPLPFRERIKVRGKPVNPSAVCEFQTRRKFKMSKKILFCSLFILIFLIPSKQDPNAKTWERHNTTVQADSILVAIDRGEDIEIDSCEICGSIEKESLGAFPFGIIDVIKSSIIIRGTIFYDKVTFRYLSFKHSVGFFRCVFAKEVDFTGSVFVDDAGFSGSTFKDFANFSFSTFRFGAFFGYTTFSGGVDFEDATFCGEVQLAPNEFKNINISWKQLDGHLHYHTPSNLMLLRYWEERRQFDDADGVYLFLKDQERMKKPWYIRYPEYWLFQLPCGYGVKPLNTVYLSIVIIFVFSLFYTKRNAIKEIEKEIGYRRRRRTYRVVRRSFGKRLYDALYFSVHTFIIGIVADWHPTDEFLIDTRRISLFRFRIFRIAGRASDRYPTEEFLISTKGIKLFKFRTLAMIEGALGWILVILFIISLGKKFIR